MAIVLLAAGAAAFVFLWYLPHRSGDPTDSTVTTQSSQPSPSTQTPGGPISSANDVAAQMLIRNGMTAVESAYIGLMTFDQSVMTPELLGQAEPSISFAGVPNGTAATAPVSLASNNAVDFYGTATTYALGTRSDSGNTFGVMVTKAAGGRTSTFYVNGGVRDWNPEVSSAATLPTPASTTAANAPTIVARHQEPALGCSFEYPASWVEYPPEVLNEAADAFATVYAVTDPLGGRVGNVPADYIMFAAQREEQQPVAAPSSKLESLADSLAQTSLAGATVIEPTNAFALNGISAAAKTYRMEDTEIQTIWRLVCLVSGERVFYFVFVSEAPLWSDNKGIFDATLGSFQSTVLG